MLMGTPRIDQGQMLVRSYGWHDGSYYMRIVDKTADRRHSFGSDTEWFVADAASTTQLAETSYDAAGATYRPAVMEWVPCKDPLS